MLWQPYWKEDLVSRKRSSLIGRRQLGMVNGQKSECPLRLELEVLWHFYKQRIPKMASKPPGARDKQGTTAPYSFKSSQTFWRLSWSWIFKPPQEWIDACQLFMPPSLWFLLVLVGWNTWPDSLGLWQRLLFIPFCLWLTFISLSLNLTLTAGLHTHMDTSVLVPNPPMAAQPSDRNATILKPVLCHLGSQNCALAT